MRSRVHAQKTCAYALPRCKAIRTPISALCWMWEVAMAIVYVAYEWLEPRNLLDGLVDGLRLSQIRHIFIGLLQAIRHLESLSLVHGDIKPSNILLRGRQEPVLIDVCGGHFGDGEFGHFYIDARILQS